MKKLTISALLIILVGCGGVIPNLNPTDSPDGEWTLTAGEKEKIAFIKMTNDGSGTIAIQFDGIGDFKMDGLEISGSLKTLSGEILFEGKFNSGYTKITGSFIKEATTEFESDELRPFEGKRSNKIKGYALEIIIQIVTRIIGV